MVGIKHAGFTLVELMIVIVVIAILATIAFTTNDLVQKDSRDGARATQATLIAELIEKYYTRNGIYPTCAEMQAAPATVSASTLVGIDTSILKTPSAPTNQANSIVCTAANGTEDVFEYILASDCLSWVLRYKSEATNTKKEISNRQVQPVAPPAETIPGQTFTYDDVAYYCAAQANRPAGYNLVTGTSGTSGNDIKYANDGNFYNLGDGNDIICATGGSGVYNAGNGNDVMYVTNADVAVNGNAGNDVIIMVNTEAVANGNDNDDYFYISGSSINVTASGGNGTDRYRVMNGATNYAVSTMEGTF